jgi:hypothetical protein
MVRVRVRARLRTLTLTLTLTPAVGFTLSAHSSMCSHTAALGCENDISTCIRVRVRVRGILRVGALGSKGDEKRRLGLVG